MNRTRIIILAVAAVAAIGLAVILRGALGGGSEPVQTVAAPPPAPMARVLVAARELPVGTRLTPADLRWQEWPVGALNAAYITDGGVRAARPVPAAARTAGTETEGGETAAAGANASGAANASDPPARPNRPGSRRGGSANEGDSAAQRAERERARATASERFMATLTGHPSGATGALEGMIVREALLQGEPITEGKLVRGGDSGMMAVVLQPGMRAMAVPVSVETAAGGFILPGDHVDVLMSRQDQGAAGQGAFRVATVLRNIRVLAVDQSVEPEDGAQTVVGATATLEVGAREAEILALAKAAGTLALTLRSYADLDAPSGVGSLAGAALGGDSPSERQPIRVWRGGTPTEVAQR